MAAFDSYDPTYTGPSDHEVVAMLQRMASARAQLLKAEQAAADTGRSVANRRNDAIEEAHADLLWAQAQLCASVKDSRARREVELAEAREKAVLRRFGYSSFRDYLKDRTSPPTTDLHLQLARKEYEAAQTEWENLQREIAAATLPTLVIDVTGDTPRPIL